jgi:hypothetical protein
MPSRGVGIISIARNGARKLNMAALDHAIYAPLGSYLIQHAWRKNVTGLEGGLVPFCWNVAKSA